MNVDEEVLAALVELGLLQAGATAVVHRLTGGVSSDVFRVDLPTGPVCVKGALAQLRVAADWRAPVERSGYEVAWLREAQAIPGVQAPHVLAALPERNLFVMTFFDPATHRLWKSELAEGRVSVPFAGEIGAALSRIHAATAGSARVAGLFQTRDLFEALRVSPYLLSTADAHPDLAPRIRALAAQTLDQSIALVHGDISPKNILMGPQGPVFLDAECAWYGDPAFDLAFCATHLLLKTVWRPAHRAQYLAAFEALVGQYMAGAGWEPREGLEARAARLTAALLLARVDGKSPVEYLQADDDKTFVRETARSLIAADEPTLAGLAGAWTLRLEAR